MTNTLHRRWALIVPPLAAIAWLGGCDRSEPVPDQAAPPVAAPSGASEQAAPGPAPSSPAATPAPGAASPSAPTAGGAIDASGLTFSLPAGWSRRTPGTMRVAELSAGAPEGSNLEAAEVAFFSFGPQGAGDAASNVARWASLVHDEGGQPAAHEESTERVGELAVTLIESRGTYQSGSPAGPKTPRPDFALFGAIIEGGAAGPLYIRMTGPSEVMSAHRERWLEMVRSARKSAP